MTISSAEACRVVETLRAHNHIVVAGHGNADSDAIGATSALGYLLRSLGKDFALYNATGVPEHLAWLSLPAPVHTRISALPFKPKLFVALDSGDIWRLGDELAEKLHHYPSINVDHHLGNPEYGSLANWIDPGMASTGQMVATLADICEVPLRGGLAQGIYLSLVGDTGSFSHGNTTAAVHYLAARLLEGGLDAAGLRNQLDNQWTCAKTRLWGHLMQNLHLEDNGRIGVAIVSRDLLREHKASKEDLEGFVEQLRRIKGVRIGLLIREDAPKRCKISLRSSGDDDVRAVAARYEGGGHKNAAGATLNKSLDSILELLLPALREIVA